MQRPASRLLRPHKDRLSVWAHVPSGSVLGGTMRNLLAILVGVAVAIGSAGTVGFLLMKLEVSPFVEFARGNFSDDPFALMEKVLLLSSLVILPLISLPTGLVAAACARNKEYLVALASSLPILVAFFDLSLHFLLMVFSVAVSATIGARAAKYLKSRKRVRG